MRNPDRKGLKNVSFNLSSRDPPISVEGNEADFRKGDAMKRCGGHFHDVVDFVAVRAQTINKDQ
jgi:hypothetical protein